MLLASGRTCAGRYLPVGKVARLNRLVSFASYLYEMRLPSRLLSVPRLGRALGCGLAGLSVSVGFSTASTLMAVMLAADAIALVAFVALVRTRRAEPPGVTIPGERDPMQVTQSDVAGAPCQRPSQGSGNRVSSAHPVSGLPLRERCARAWLPIARACWVRSPFPISSG